MKLLRQVSPQKTAKRLKSTAGYSCGELDRHICPDVLRAASVNLRTAWQRAGQCGEALRVVQLEEALARFVQQVGRRMARRGWRILPVDPVAPAPVAPRTQKMAGQKDCSVVAGGGKRATCCSFLLEFAVQFE